MLADALASVSAQGEEDVEIIVVDGGSDDGTPEMLQSRRDVLLIDDRRRGLYDALNLGIERASGDIIGLLNSDDLYAPGAFAAVRRAFEKEPQAGAVCGRAELFDASQVVKRYDDPRDLCLDAHSALVGASIINARFFRRDVMQSNGVFATDYHFVADREFLTRMLIRGLRTVAIETLVYRYRRHPGSLTFAEGADRTEPLRMELLRLARAVASHRSAKPAICRKAIALEGRCLARIALERARIRDWRGVTEILTDGEDCLTRSPLLSVGFGLIDRMMMRRRGLRG